MNRVWPKIQVEQQQEEQEDSLVHPKSLDDDTKMKVYKALFICIAFFGLLTALSSNNWVFPLIVIVLCAATMIFAIFAEN